MKTRTLQIFDGKFAGDNLYKYWFSYRDGDKEIASGFCNEYKISGQQFIAQYGRVGMVQIRLKAHTTVMEGLKLVK